MGGIFSSLSSFGEHTPIKNRTLPTEFDPRSPSVDILRTPIVVPYTPISAKEFTPIREKLPLKTTEAKLNQLFDPRSPVAEFNRTPILSPIKFNFSELEQALQNKHKKTLEISSITDEKLDLLAPILSNDNSLQKELADEMSAEQHSAAKVKPNENVATETVEVSGKSDNEDCEEHNKITDPEPGILVNKEEELHIKPIKCSTPIKQTVISDNPLTPKNTPVTPLAIRQHHNSPVALSSTTKKDIKNASTSKGTPVTREKGLRHVAHKNQRRRKNIVTSDENSPMPIRI